MERLEELPDRVAALDGRMASLAVQVLQFREEVHDEFSALRADMRAGDEQTRREMRDLNDETRTQMRVLHEEVISRIAVLDEHQLHDRSVLDYGEAPHLIARRGRQSDVAAGQRPGSGGGPRQRAVPTDGSSGVRGPL
jgi:hypothetical protein